jgi:hypothetical protein
VDQSRVALGQRLVSEAEARQQPLPEVHHQHVGVGEQPVDDPGGRVLLEIERQTTFVAVERLEGRRESIGAAPEAAQRIAAERLDLDDVGAHVRQLERGRRPLDVRGHVDDADSVQRTHPDLPDSLSKT